MRMLPCLGGAAFGSLIGYYFAGSVTDWLAVVVGAVLGFAYVQVWRRVHDPLKAGLEYAAGAIFGGIVASLPPTVWYGSGYWWLTAIGAAAGLGFVALYRRSQGETRRRFAYAGGVIFWAAVLSLAILPIGDAVLLEPAATALVAGLAGLAGAAFGVFYVRLLLRSRCEPALG